MRLCSASGAGSWVLAVALTACTLGGGDELPRGVPPAGPAPTATTAPPSTSVAPTDVPTTHNATSTEVVAIDVDAPGRPIDPRLFGTNVPAWLGPDRLGAPWLREALVDAGITTIRMPGGSWSNEYGWSACELRVEGCIWEGAARPSDFAALLTATGLDGIWTVSINETAQSAAATVAFFNGDVDDDRAIGVDRDGVDWGTVGEWASLRVEGGGLEPARIGLWEVGNEVYGGRPDAGGDQCAPFGWERVWTCDGAEYVFGNDEHDGYLEIRSAMLAVDPTIEVGAVGVAEAGSWSNWGNEVIEAAGDALDFYVVHQYGFDSSPSPEATASRAAELWPPILTELRDSLGTDVPIAITEYNLVSFEAGDTERSMTTVANALYIADSIGQLAEHDVEIASQWNLANGTTESGTDYGLVSAETGERFPQFEALAAWGRAGDVLLPIEGAEHLDESSIYATRRADGSVVVTMLHPRGEPREITISLDGLQDGSSVASTSWSADTPEATAFVTDSGRSDISSDGVVITVLGPWSITQLHVSPNSM